MTPTDQTANLNPSKILSNTLVSPNICFLFGAGASKSVGYPLMKELTTLATERPDTTHPVRDVLSRLKGRTIEEQLDELYGQLRSPALSQISPDLLQESTDHILNVIYDECAKPAQIDAHRAFVRAVVQRQSAKKRIHILTTNYDMLFEWASDAERLLCVNGFFGVQARMFDSTQFDLRHARVVQGSRLFGSPAVTFHPCIELYKLHGSVSWISDGESITEIPILFGTKRAPGQLMVFPTPHKIAETWTSPYSDLFARMADLLHVRQTALITLGFSFADSHFPPIVEKCLADNTFILVILSKDMLPSFDVFRPFRNAIIITKDLTIFGGQEYQIETDLWTFPRFVDVYAGS